MTTAFKVHTLSTLTTHDEAGRHFTTRFSRAEISELETDGFIVVTRPVHEATGIAYDERYWSVEVTEAGRELLEDYPEHCAN